MQKKTVSIGIAAYNEENTIRKVLSSIISQEEVNIAITEILVISDGSSDRTVKQAKSINDKRIKVFEDGKRLGKASRVSQIFSLFSSDYIILIDADMYMSNSAVVECMISEFKHNKRVHLVTGFTHPLPGKTFIEKSINNYRFGRESVKKRFKFGETMFGAHAFLALTKKFAKETKLPVNILNDDAFLYFDNLSRGYLFRNSSKSIVLYRSPQTIKDHINQATRHFAGGLQLRKYFDNDLIYKESKIPLSINFDIMLYQLRKNPVGYVLLKIINIYCKFISFRKNKNFDIRWEEITTSKSL